MLWQERKKKTNPFWQFKKEKTSLANVIKLRNSNTILYWIAPQKLDRKNLTFGVFYYATISPSRSARCETKKPPAMRVRVEGYTKKTPNAIQ